MPRCPRSVIRHTVRANRLQVALTAPKRAIPKTTPRARVGTTPPSCASAAAQCRPRGTAAALKNALCALEWSQISSGKTLTSVLPFPEFFPKLLKFPKCSGSFAFSGTFPELLKNLKRIPDVFTVMEWEKLEQKS